MPDGATIQRMFAEVAPGYDRANRALSLGIDVWWRKRAVGVVAVQKGEVGLDVCSGTGDLAFALQRAGARMIGADFCPPMLACTALKGTARSDATGSDATRGDTTRSDATRGDATRGDTARSDTTRSGLSAGRPEFLAADALELPFRADSFDFATVAFGIRNVSDPVAALREMARVVRPGGRVVVLEFCKPRVPLLGAAYRFYFRRVLPRLGSMLSGARNDAYRYLHDSVMAFPEREQFLALMTSAGLAAPSQRLLTGGIAAVYRGEVER